MNNDYISIGKTVPAVLVHILKTRVVLGGSNYASTLDSVSVSGVCRPM